MVVIRASGDRSSSVSCCAVHLGSLCVWIRAVAALWLLTRATTDCGPLADDQFTAVIGLAASGASGFLLSGRVVATVTALFSTTYGHRIVIKAAVIVAMAAFGAMARRRVVRNREPGLLPLELAVAGVAVVVAALLVGSAPARGPQFSPVSAAAPQIVTTDARDLTVSASIEPARPGPNLVQVRVLETRRPSPGPVDSVTIRVVGGDGSVVAERVGRPADGLVEWADVVVPSPGLYRVEVDVARPTLPVSPVVASWQVEPTPVPRAPTVVSTFSWAPIAAGLALVWVLLVAAGWWATGRISRAVPASGETSCDRSFGCRARWAFRSRGSWHDSTRREKHPADPRMGKYISGDGSQLNGDS
jgi:hypothetical protein